MTLSTMRSFVKQSLGNRSQVATAGTLIDDTWYENRLDEGYLALLSEQSFTQGPGSRAGAGPTRRILRFPELEDRQARSLTTATAGAGFLSNVSGNLIVHDIWDRTNDRPLTRPPEADFFQRDPDETGTPREFFPTGRGGLIGYALWPVPAASADEIDVYEYVLLKPTAMTGESDNYEPEVTAEWHMAICMRAAALGALLLDWPEKEAELMQRYQDYVSRLVTLRDKQSFTGRAGARGYIQVGGYGR